MNSSPTKPIQELKGLLNPLITGLVFVFGGYFIGLDQSKQAQEIKEVGVETNATVISRNFTGYLNDDDQYYLSYLFWVGSPGSPKSQYYIKQKHVSRSIYNSVQGCQEVVEPLILKCDFETREISGIEVQVCDDANAEVINIQVKDCEPLPIIYNSTNPTQSWILGTQPTSGSLGYLLILIGIIFFGVAMIQFLRSRTMPD